MDERLISYLYFFNTEQDYYACHEYGESLWLELGRPQVLKGFIQAAVCLYHLSNGNLRGATTMWNRAKGYLRDGLPSYQCIDTKSLIQDIDEIFSMVHSKFTANMVMPESIHQLQLPIVKINLLDESIHTLVHEYTPKPLRELEP